LVLKSKYNVNDPFAGNTDSSSLKYQRKSLTASIITTHTTPTRTTKRTSLINYWHQLSVFLSVIMKLIIKND
jgi:hypothetical protein